MKVGKEPVVSPLSRWSVVVGGSATKCARNDERGVVFVYVAGVRIQLCINGLGIASGGESGASAIKS